MGRLLVWATTLEGDTISSGYLATFGMDGWWMVLYLSLIIVCDRSIEKKGSSPGPARNSYLVDPASSHMLVSKIKPCMCKYKLFCTVKLRMAH